MFDVNLCFSRILVFGQQVLHVCGDRRVGGKEKRDPHFAFDSFEEPLRFVRERVFLVARKIPALVMFKSDRIDRYCQKQNQNNLRQNVKTNLNPADFFWSRGLLRLLCLVSH